MTDAMTHAEWLLAVILESDRTSPLTLAEIAPIHAAVASIAQREHAKTERYQQNYAAGRAAAMSRIARERQTA